MIVGMNASRPIVGAVLLAAGVLVGGYCVAAPPDLTNGGVPSDDPYITINLGPTGARGWVYHVNRVDTGESRQILVTKVDAGSPADGVLAVDDVILGADGTGADPAAFSSDARKTLGLAIGDAEARSPATLKLLRWRSGSTNTVTLTLETMGAYTATAPYNCPKSAKVLADGLQYVYDNETAGRYSFGGITLLVTNNPTYRAKAQTIARALVPSAARMAEMMADEKDDSGGLPAWERGHVLIFLTEYYLATRDSQVLPAIEAYAVNLAKNSSMFGTLGHGFADRNADGTANGPITGGYGTVNTPALFALLGLELALECGLTNPEIAPAIERASNFFAFHTDKGAIPYGDHEPFFQQHENNGKCGTSALAFMFQTNRVEEAKFFAKMCTASATEREHGHTGAFFNYVWAPLGAAAGGPDMAAKLFGRLSWVYDLSRCWDGRFQYDCLNGEGHHSGSTWYNFRMSTAALLTYALPLRQLRITGKGHDPSRWLTATDADEAAAADDYDADSRSDSELIVDIDNWSPKVRYEAAVELSTRSIDASELAQITALATDTGGTSRSRAGACYALGQIGNSSSAPILAGLITDPDRYVRYFATEGMRHLPTSARLAQLDTILSAAVSTAEPLLPIMAEDPLHMGHSKLAMLLFNDVLSGSLDGVDRNLLYPAIRAVAETPVGKGRSALQSTYENLTYDDVLALSETIVDSIVYRAPADVMFLHGVRAGGMTALHKYDIAEGVPAGMLYAENTYWNGDNRIQAFERLGAYGGSLLDVTPDPGAVPFLEPYVVDADYNGQVSATVVGILNGVASDTNPRALTALKRITSATADGTVLTLPVNSTVLRVSGIDHMHGDSIYTWRKTLGPGGFSITPNGTSNTVSTLQLDGTPGAYQFEVTMSDSRGFTEVHETVTVFLRADGEVDEDPPLPNPASFDAAPAADSETAISMTAATGADVTGPVQYLFTETTGNPGGSTSSWQTSPTYTDSGLSPLTQYAYMVTTRDSLGNVGTTSSAVGATTPGTPPPSDIISVNFYAYGGLPEGDRDAVTLEADESAGLGAWNTAGWENYSVPWGLSSPAAPVGIASGLGATATLTLNDVRNGGPHAWDAPHSLLSGDGNGDLMDGHCNATEDPGDQSSIFDMTVSGIPFGTYDVIVYMGANAAQYGDGTAKYVFNGGSEQDFTLSPGAFAAFSEIANATTPGNYVLFQNVTGSSFTLKVWGDGFNHIGPTGFQIASAGSTSDANPPTPNAATFAVSPYASSSSNIGMTATAGSDATGPVEYLFSCLSAGGHGSGWQTSPSYTDTGLAAGTEYTYTVTMRDAVTPTPNVGTPSAATSATTAIGVDTNAPDPDPMTWSEPPALATEGPLVYEAFDYPAGGDLTNSGGLGFAGGWVSTRTGGDYFSAQNPGLTFTDSSANDLPVAGNSARRETAPSRAGASRMIFPDARTALFADGSTMWFSLLHQKTKDTEGAAFVIGTGTFDLSRADFGDYSENGEGFGFGSDGDLVLTAIRYDDATGLAVEDSSVSPATVKLIAGKIVWRANGSNDVLSLYNVTDLATEPTNPIATLTADLDQSDFDRISFKSTRNTAVYDEIRLGASFEAVTSAEDGGGPAVSMTATTATDPSGVEYYFTCTAGGGNNSGWQNSSSYTDTGLSAGAEYTYTVAARDRSTDQNTTAASPAASVRIPGTSANDPVPDVVGMTESNARAAIVAGGFTVGTVSTAGSPTVPAGDVISQDPAAGAQASAGSPVHIVVSLGDVAPDIISVNFYGYGNMDTGDYHTVTLEAGESAGVAPHNTTGWENYLVPWGLESPAAPVTIESVRAETATLTLNDVRNGGPYVWNSPHANLPGDGSGDLMDGHCNGTEDPYDGSLLFDMRVSDIPYTVYDLIVYIGANSAQFGDGSGKIVLNGGAEQGFTLPSGVFASFAEITDEATPGNYIVYSGLRSSNLTLRAWGNGFNHIGPTGFQIVQDISGLTPPGSASNPSPEDGVVGLPPNTDLNWTVGVDATSRDVYFGTNATPGASEFQDNVIDSTFDPGTLPHGTYYWRIDEVNGDGKTTGPVWSFEVGTPAKAFRPMPQDGMSAVARHGVTLSWLEGASASAVSNDVYFGIDATPDAGEFRGNQATTTFSLGTLAAGTTYYWRIDQVNAQGTTTGDVWSFATPKAGANKVKIFIMAGQSNTEGHGEMDPVGTPGTLAYTVANEAATYGHLKDGASWAVRDDAWIWYKRGGSTLVKGGLTAGYGASGATIGPELQFGHAMADYYGETVLIIKTAWGGKSLRTDFRPPSSGWGLDTPVTAGDEGFYYKEMLDAVANVMGNLATHFPVYDPADGYELAGFGWHQGWNDRVTPAFAAEYETNMVNFITDVRAALGVPALPFVIATTGMDGNPDFSEVELAQLEMANVTAYPQFESNVAVTNTQNCWFDVASSPANQGYHWNRNAKSYLLIGQAMADEMQTLVTASGGSITPRSWVLAYGGDPALVNEDGDELTLDQEFLINTDPTSSNRFEITAFGTTPGTQPWLQYRANGMPNGTLSVLSCTNLAIGSWRELTGALSMPSSNVVQWTGSDAVQSNGVLRVQVVESRIGS
jgi:hypothetical protein